MKKLCLFVVVLVMLSSSLCLADSSVFSNLSSPGAMYTPFYSIGSGHTQGFGFTSGSSVNLTTISIVLGNLPIDFAGTLGTGNPTISLYDAASDWSVGSLLQSWTVQTSTLTPTELDGHTTHVTILNAVGIVALTKDANYWLIGTNDMNTHTSWYLNNNNDYQSWSEYYGIPGKIQLSGRALSGAFEINGVLPTPPPDPTATPEPATMLLLGLGLMGLAGARRKVRK